MKDLISKWQGKAERVSFCASGPAKAEDRNPKTEIQIAGLTLVPDEDTAYCEFYLSHCFPVVNKYRTGILPQVVANSHRSLVNKVFNLAHLMKAYNPEVTRDRVLGTVVAVEFVDGEGAVIAELNPEGGFALAADKESQGIRAVAVMHKAAEMVPQVLESWESGRDTFGGAWTVSIENSFYEEDCGFIVKGREGLTAFLEKTPGYLNDLGWTYVPCRIAPTLLMSCLNNKEDDERDGYSSTRVVRNYRDQETLLLLGGLDGKIRYRGVGLTPEDGAREKEARVATMLAAEPVVDVAEMLNPLLTLGKSLFE